MHDIEIIQSDEWNFSFRTDDQEETMNSNFYRCSYCKITSLSPVYSYIISCLEESGLLDESYKPICCFCAVLKEFGMLELSDDLNRIDYSGYLDVLQIKFSFGVNKKDKIRFRIYGYSKIDHRCCDIPRF